MTENLDFKTIGKGLGAGAILLVIGLFGEAIARDTGITNKLSKASADYKKTYSASPFGDMVGPIRYRCEHCWYFKDGNACRIVQGPIEAAAGCKRWLGIKAEKS